jgi:hypothetical protein
MALGFDALSENPLGGLTASGPVVINFSSSTTDGADVLLGNVALLIAVSSATTDGADVLASQVGPVVGLTSATTDGADTLASQVGVVVGVTSSYTDGADILAAAVEVVSAGAISFSSATTDGSDVLASIVEIISDAQDKKGGDDAPRKVKTEKYKPRLKKDDFGNEIQPVSEKLVEVKKVSNYTLQDTKLLLNRLELQAEQDDEEALFMLL